LTGSPAWNELEQEDTRALAVLEYFARLGPAHAALPDRYALLAPVLLALVVGAAADPENTSLAQYGQRLLRSAARNAWQSPEQFLLASHRGPSGFRLATLIDEGGSLGRQAHRLYRHRLAADLRDLATTAWSFLGQDPADLPTLIFHRPGDDLDTGHVGQFIREESLGNRVFVNAERATLAAVVRNHRQLRRNGVSDTEIARYEPCAFLAPRLCADPPGLVLLHELIHAAVPTKREAYDPAGRHHFVAAGVARAWRAAGQADAAEEIFIAGALITAGGSASTSRRLADWTPVHGTILLDEALTEALTLELAPGLAAAAPDLFVAPARLWGGRLAPVASSYAEGVRFLAALLGPGTSVQPYLFAPDQPTAFRAALREHLSPAAAAVLERAIYTSDGAGFVDGEVDTASVVGWLSSETTEEELVFDRWRDLVEQDRARTMTD
jgi:hypothetical protein